MLKNFTVSADEDLIQRARAKALKEKRSLNSLVREWIEQYVGQKISLEEFRVLMRRLSYANPGRKFTRDEMNER